jgi:CheY-like chemotaxis protein
MASELKTVVVAEDETVVRITAVEILMDAGFQVIEAKHAEEALSALRSRYRAIHLLFTDISMAGLMSGLELAHHVRAEWPHIALLILSGDDEPLPDKLPAGSVFLAKPYSFAQVVAHVHALLAA